MTAARSRWDSLRVALALATLTYVWRAQDLFPGTDAFKPLTVVTGVVVLLFILDGRASRQLSVVLRHRLSRLVLLLAVLAAVSVPTSLWPGMSFDFLLKDALPNVALTLAIAAGISDVADARRFAAAQVFGAALYSVVVLTRFSIGPSGRLGNLVFYDANDLGMLLVCTLPLAAFFIRYARTIVGRLAAASLLVLFILTIVKTGSRGAFLGLLAVTGYMLFRYRAVSVSKRVGLAVAAALVLTIGASTAYWTQMSTLLAPTQDYNWIGKQEGGRMNVWRRGIGYMMARPITGVGLWVFPVAEGTISPLAGQQEYGDGLKWSAAHNSFVQVGAELGVPGLVVFCALLAIAVRTMMRLARDTMRGAEQGATSMLAEAHASGLIGYAVTGFFLSQAYGAYFYFVLGMVIGLDGVARAQRRSSQPSARLARRAALAARVPAPAAGNWAVPTPGRVTARVT
jgi:O-antigen ligase